MIRSLISEIKEFKSHRFWLPCSWSLKSCLRFRFPLSWRVFWTRCSTKKHEQYFVLRWLMLVCAFCSLLCGMQSARYGAYNRLVLLKPSSGHFQKVQTFSFENIDQFSSGWVSHSDDDGRNQCKMPIKWSFGSVYGHRSI